MIQDLVSRSLILAFGYAYPAYKCYKTIEKNKVDIKELRFWCQYWIIIAVVTVIESFIDLLISWFPMYREIKLALFICLWHPGLQGTGFVYNTLLQPYVSRYETDIDRGLLELKQRAWDLVSDYWRYSSEMGSKKAAQLFHLMLSQSARVAAPVPPADQHAENESNVAPPPPPPPTPPSTPSGPLKRTKSDKRPPIPTSGPSTPRRDGTPKHSSFKVQLHKQTQFIHSTPDTDVGNGSEETSDGEHDLHTPNPGQGRRSTHFKSN